MIPLLRNGLRDRWTTMLIVLWAFGTAALVLTHPAASDTDSADMSVDPVRLVVVGGFLLVAPGLVAVRLLGLTDRLLSAVTAMGTSLVLLVAGAQLSLYLHRWSPNTVVAIIAGLTATGGIASIFRRSQC